MTVAARALNDGLDLSFKRDPIWGAPQPDAIYTRYYARPSGKRRRRAILEQSSVMGPSLSTWQYAEP